MGFSRINICVYVNDLLLALFMVIVPLGKFFIIYLVNSNISLTNRIVVNEIIFSYIVISHLIFAQVHKHRHRYGARGAKTNIEGTLPHPMTKSLDGGWVSFTVPVSFIS